MQQTLFNSPSLLFFPCSVSSQPKVFWKFGVSKFFVEILEKHWRRISFFYIVASWRATFLIQRLLGFGMSSSWQLCSAVILKNTFFSTASVFASIVYNTVDYIMQHHCG